MTRTVLRISSGTLVRQATLTTVEEVRAACAGVIDEETYS